MKPPHDRRWSFSFRTLFVGMTVAAIASISAPIAWKRYQEWAAAQRRQEPAQVIGTVRIPELEAYQAYERQRDARDAEEYSRQLRYAEIDRRDAEKKRLKASAPVQSNP